MHDGYGADALADQGRATADERRSEPLDEDDAARGPDPIGRSSARRNESHDLRDELRRARAGGDWETLNRLWLRHGLGLVARASSVALKTYGTLPPAVMESFPSLGVAAAALGLPGVADVGGRAAIDVATAQMARLASRVSPRMPASTALDLLSSAMVQARVVGDDDRALELLERLDSERAARNMRGEAITHSADAWSALQAANTLLVNGGLADARVRAESALRLGLAARIDGEHVVVNAAGILALVYALEGEGTLAEQWVARASAYLCDPFFEPFVRVPMVLAARVLRNDRLEWPTDSPMAEIAARSIDPETELGAYVALIEARAALRDGAAGRALDVVGRAVRAHSAPDGSVRTPVAAILSGVATDALVLADRTAEARHRLDDLGRRLGAHAKGPGLLLSRARLLLTGGEARKALSTVSALTTEPGATTRERLRACLIIVEALHVLGDEERARRTFDDAVETARRHRLESMLGQLSASCISSLPPVPELSHPHRVPSFPVPRSLPALTTRERIVLEALADGGTVADTATRLHVSLNTVKAQLRSIYTKLGVGSRDEAVVRAARFGLIAPPPPSRDEP